MHSAFDERQFDGMEAAQKQLTFFQEHFPKAVPAAKYRYTAKAVELAAVLFSSGGDRDCFQRLRRFADQYSSEVIKDSRVKRSMKFRIRAVKMGYYPAKLVLRLHEKAKKQYGQKGGHLCRKTNIQ